MDVILEKLATWITETGISLICGILVLLIGLKAVKIAIRFLSKSKGFQKLDKTLQGFLKSALKITLNIAVLITAAVILGIPTTSFITILASAGLAIGMAFQGSLANFAGGILLLLHKPFKEGDYIESNGLSGTVRNLSVLYTTINTFDNKQITIPNGTLANNPITNYSAEQIRRVDLSFTAAYGSNIDRVKNLLIETAKKEPLVSQDKEIFAGLEAQEESALKFSLRVWCSPDDYWTVYYNLNEQVKKEFDSSGIEIPFPQIDVHVKPTENK